MAYQIVMLAEHDFDFKRVTRNFSFLKRLCDSGPLLPFQIPDRPTFAVSSSSSFSLAWEAAENFIFLLAQTGHSGIYLEWKHVRIDSEYDE